MRKRNVVILLAGVLLVAGGWCFNQWISRPTDNLDINHKLRSIQQGQTLPLAAIVGVDAVRVCWVIPAYEYAKGDNFAETYISGILGATVHKAPTDISDGEGGSTYLFLSYPDGKTAALRLVSGWRDFLEKYRPTENWCAPVANIVVERDKEGWLFMSAGNKEIHNLPQ